MPSAPAPYSSFPNRLREDLRAGKGTIYEGGVKACAFANWPGHIKSNTVVNARRASAR